MESGAPDPLLYLVIMGGAFPGHILLFQLFPLM